jgi:glycine cleavage system H protein
VVESVKAASDIYAPIAGTVLATNEQLSQSPELVNRDPYGSGWLMRLKPAQAAGGPQLLSPEAYTTLAEEG